jgi:hypothetical protein
MLRRQAEASRQEDGNLRFDVVQHVMRANHFTVIEIWRNQAAFDEEPNTSGGRRSSLLLRQDGLTVANDLRSARVDARRFLILRDAATQSIRGSDRLDPAIRSPDRGTHPSAAESVEDATMEVGTRDTRRRTRRPAGPPVHDASAAHAWSTAMRTATPASP